MLQIDARSDANIFEGTGLGTGSEISAKEGSVPDGDAISRKLPRTQCPKCSKPMSQKSLIRHNREVHYEGTKKYKCDLCQYKSKREACLLDHIRRKHFEATALGRPKKGQKRRTRSPFRVDTFNKRHQSALEFMNLSNKLLDDNTQQKCKFESRFEEKLNELDEKNRYIEALVAKQNEEMGKILAFSSKEKKMLEEKVRELEVNDRNAATRMSILESKVSEKKVPDVTDIPSLLKYFNLPEDCNKATIRNTVNLRLMSVSPGSTLSKEIFSTGMTKEERENLVIDINSALKTLLKWQKNRDNKQSNRKRN